jgi:hypothetical protein
MKNPPTNPEAPKICLFHVLVIFQSILFAGEQSNVRELMGSQTNQTSSSSNSFVQFNDLWKTYLTGNPLQKAKVVCSLNQIPKVFVSNQLEIDICSTFSDNPTADKALFLGMCKSSNSLDLLNRSITNNSLDVERAVKLALARRGNQEYEALFIRQYVSHPISQKATLNLIKDPSSYQVIWDLKYIGSPNSIATLFDSVGTPREYDSKNISISRITPTDIQNFLRAVGVDVPDTITTDQRMATWWKKQSRADSFEVEPKRQAEFSSSL